MNLRTRYLGLDLPHPVMPGASPLVDDLDSVRRLEDAGAAAIVMHSLFEEQIVNDELATMRYVDVHEHSSAEAMSYTPGSDYFRLGPDEYLEQIRRIKEIVDLPIIGSLNGTTLGGWLDYATLIEKAGADALELNIYEMVSDPEASAESVEARTEEMVRTLKRDIGIPVAIKLSPFYTALPHFAARMERCGADGLVLFNRFYQPDIDIEELEVQRTLQLSGPQELLLRLRWLAVLSGRVRCDLAASGGIHETEHVIKAIMTGATIVQMVSALLRNGPERIGTVLAGLRSWLEEHEYDSIDQMRGSMNDQRCPDPSAFERVNYVQILQTWEA